MQRAFIAGVCFLLTVAAGCGAGQVPAPRAGPGEVSLRFPDEGARTNGFEFGVGVFVQGAPAVITIFIDDVEIIEGNPSMDTTRTNQVIVLTLGLPQSMSDGSHVLRVEATVDGVTVAPPPRNFILDRSPPTLVSVSPPADSSVCPSDAFTFEFSEAIAPWGGSAADFAYARLSDGGMLTTDAELQANPRFVVIHVPPAGLPASSVAGTFTVNPYEVVDLTGNRSDQRFSATWSFDAGCP